MKKHFAVVFFIFNVLSGWPQGNPADIPMLMKKLAQSKEDTSRINIFINLAASYIVEVRAPNRLDSVTAYLRKARQLNNRFKIPSFRNSINLYSALLQFQLYSPDDPKQLFLPVIDSCKRTGDKFNEARSWMLLGQNIEEAPQTNPYKLTCFQNGLTLALQIKDSFTALELQEEIAYMSVAQNRFDQAEQEFGRVLEKALHTSPVISMFTYDKMTRLYTLKGEFNKALDYALKTQAMLGVTKDSAFADEYYSRIGWVYRYLNKDQERHDWAKKQLEFHMAANDIPGSYKNIVILCRLIREEGNPEDVFKFIQKKLGQRRPGSINDERILQHAMGETYNYQKRYNLAEKCFIELARLSKLQKLNYDIRDRGVTNFTIGRFYFDRGLYKKARPFLEASLKIYESYGFTPAVMSNHLYLFKTDSVLANYVSAIRHIQHSTHLKDSSFTVTKNRQVEELEVSYQTEQKDKSIKLLREKEKLALVQLQVTQNTRNWIIAGAVMLFIIAGLLYRQTTMRKNNNAIISDKNKQLQHLVTEKEWLLKEVHHRVKNNLHTVIGLLESQAAHLQDDALKANEISKHRIYAMSLIHQQLYKAEDIKTIDMTVFLPELLDYLSESFGTGKKIQFRRSIAPVKLSVSQAIPVALIVNEAVTNAIKYAFVPGQQGIVTISMQQSAKKISLVISDNGKGIDPSIITAETTSMGLKLMRGLTADIDGEINIANENGTMVRISFILEPLNGFDTDLNLALRTKNYS